MKIVFFGTPPFAVTILEALCAAQMEVIGVVTKPDKPQGRNLQPRFSAVKTYALAHHLPLYQPLKASAPEFIEFLRTLQADVFVVAAYAEILKEELLEVPRLSSINVHSSILPKYRGAAPIQRAIMAGEKETGVTIMKMAKELDAGGILAVARTPIGEEMTAGELTARLAELGAEALIKILKQLERGQVTPMAQDPQQVTYAKKITVEDARVDWNFSAEVLHNRIRAVTPHPGAWCAIALKGQPKRLLIKKAVIERAYKGSPGEILSKMPSELVVGCLDGSLRLLEVQLEGKKALPVDQFLRGISLSNLKF